MIRRDFFKTSVVLPLFGFAPDQKNDELTFKIIKTGCSFNPQKLKIAKGEFSCNWNTNCFNDIIDCHGICATQTIQQLIIQELEVNQKDLFDARSRFGYHLEEPKGFIEKFRRCKLSGLDKIKILKVCRQFAGDHDCVMNKGYWEKFDHAVRNVKINSNFC